jgi:peptide subunit release factor RF-3
MHRSYSGRVVRPSIPAYAGDILALVGNYNFLIGDTLTNDPEVMFNEMPRFTPECFHLYPQQRHG